MVFIRLNGCVFLWKPNEMKVFLRKHQKKKCSLNQTQTKLQLIHRPQKLIYVKSMTFQAYLGWIEQEN